jgi:hypothetical protein
MNHTGLDLNTSRALAVTGPEGSPARPLALDDADGALPMALSLQGRYAEVGRAGVALCREYPHLACLDFLAYLGTDRTWNAGRHRLDAGQALSLVFEKMRAELASSTALCVAVPDYLAASQVALIEPVTRKAKISLAGCVAASLASGLAAYAEQPWTGLAMRIDADDHALTWTLLKAGPEQLQLVESKSIGQLNLRVWKTCLLDAIAQWCIRHSRRDPRDSGSAEQSLYDQLDEVFEAWRQEQMAEVIVQTSTWCQNLFLQPNQTQIYCAPLVEETLEEISAAFASAHPEAVSAMLVTPTVAHLPGLVPALQEFAGERVGCLYLPLDAAARTAHELAGRIRRSGLTYLNADAFLPLPKNSLSLEAGPANIRLSSKRASDR